MAEVKVKDNENVLAGQMKLTADGRVIEEAGTGTQKQATEEAAAAEVSKIGDEIISIMQSGTKRWVDLYRMLDRVENEKLYAPQWHSLTAWARDLSVRGRFQLRELWRYKKAGRFYAEFAEREKERGRRAARLEDIDTRSGASISPRNFERVEKIAGGNTEVADKLVRQMLAGKVKAAELEELWRTKKAAGAPVRKTRHDDFAKMHEAAAEGAGASADADGTKITAADIVLAIQQASGGDWLPEERKERPYIRDKYRVFTEVPVQSGTTDHAARIDAVVAETYGVDELESVVLQGIEIKVSEYDLRQDMKMQEYADFVDFAWIAVPEWLTDQAREKAAEVQGSDKWGVLAIDADGSVRVAEVPRRLRGIMRDRVLEYLVHKLI